MLSCCFGMVAYLGFHGALTCTWHAQRLRELQEEAPDKQIMLRVEVEGGGCSGFQYKFRLDDSKAQDDL